MMRGGRGLAVVGLGSLAPQPLGDALLGRLLLRCVAKQLGHPAVERIQQPRHGSSRWLSAEERGGRFQSGVLQEEGGSTAVWLPPGLCDHSQTNSHFKTPSVIRRREIAFVSLKPGFGIKKSV